MIHIISHKYSKISYIIHIKKEYLLFSTTNLCSFMKINFNTPSIQAIKKFSFLLKYYSLSIYYLCMHIIIK